MRDSLGLLIYGRPLFPIDSLLSPSLNLYLPQIFLNIFQPSQSRSSPSLLPTGLLSNTSTVLPCSFLTTCPIHYNIFSLISATMSRSLSPSIPDQFFSSIFLVLPLVHISFLTLTLRRSRTGTVWFYTSTSNKRAARPKLYTESLTRDLKHMYSRLTLVRIYIKL